MFVRYSILFAAALTVSTTFAQLKDNKLSEDNKDFQAKGNIKEREVLEEQFNVNDVKKRKIFLNNIKNQVGHADFKRMKFLNIRAE